MNSVRKNDAINHTNRLISFYQMVCFCCAILFPILLFAQSKPTLIWVSESDSLDFGSRVAGRSYQMNATIRNISDEPRQIDEWQAACPCLQVSGMPHKIDAGTSATIVISLKTEAIDRNYYGSSVYFLSDDPVRPVLRIPVKVMWTDENGSTTPPPVPADTVTSPGQEYATPIPQPVNPIPPEESQEQDRERAAKNLSANPQLDSLLQTLPDSLRDKFKDALGTYTQRAFTGGGQEHDVVTPSQPVVPTPDTTNDESPTSDSLIEKPGELTERMFDSLSAILRGEDWVPPESADAMGQIHNRQPLVLQFFHSAMCRVCTKATRRIEETIYKYGGRVMLKHYYIDSDSGLALYIEAQQKRKVRGNPFLLTVGKANFRDMESLDSLKQAIDLALTKKVVEETPSGDALGIIRSKLRNVTFWTLVGAGLLDGVNPCAFASLIFFISLIMYVGGKKREVILVGSLFSLTVFVTYLLLGIGAFGILTQLAVYQVVANIVYILTAIIVLVLALLSMRDLWSYLNGSPPSEAVLQLPDSFKRRIHLVMREHLKPGKLAVGAIVIGFLVTLFESVCTGQVYLPTIVMLLHDPELSSQAWVYLVIYNVLFTAPLLLVFWLAYNGVTSKTIGDWSKRNYGWIKFALLLLFVALFVLMIKELMM